MTLELGVTHAGGDSLVGQETRRVGLYTTETFQVNKPNETENMNPPSSKEKYYVIKHLFAFVCMYKVKLSFDIIMHPSWCTEK